MEAPHLERKLVAILAADIEGFSSHMERDEAGTLAVLSSHRLIIDASIAEFGGRITSTAGDSVLAEFASVVSVINCAVQIQDLLADENAELEQAQRLFLRIGINVGDVMMKDGDIFGDGVNIAARLESLAEPRGNLRVPRCARTPAQASNCICGSWRTKGQEHRPTRARLQSQDGRRTGRHDRSRVGGYAGRWTFHGSYYHRRSGRRRACLLG